MTTSGRDKAIDPASETVLISAAATLEPWQRDVTVLLPDGVGDAYTITLPSVGDNQCKDAVFTFRAIESATFSNGTVTISDQDDTIRSGDYNSDPMTAALDFVVLLNAGNVIWVELDELTT